MSKLKFKYSLSVLNVSVIAGLLFLIVLSIVDWNILSGNGGWGIVYLIGVGLFILTGFIVDLILQLIFRNKKKNEFNMCNRCFNIWIFNF